MAGFVKTFSKEECYVTSSLYLKENKGYEKQKNTVAKTKNKKAHKNCNIGYTFFLVLK